MRQILIFLSIVLSPGLSRMGYSQKHSDDAYWKVVSQYAEDIVHSLGMVDSSRFYRVQNLIAQQAYDLHEIQERSKKEQLRIKYAKGSVAGKTEKLRDAQTATDKKVEKLHEAFLRNLSGEMSEEQLEKVKNGMSGGFLPIVFSAYQTVFPDLKQEEKDQIYQWLHDAREDAMKAGLSDDKYDWFGKGKKRIDNYLSSHGYNVKKLNEEWEKRIRETQK